MIKEIVQIHKARMVEERGGGVGYSEDTVRVQWGNSEGTVGYSEDTVRVQWDTVRIQ